MQRHTTRRVNREKAQGLNDPLIGMVFVVFRGTAVIDGSPSICAKPYSIVPCGFIRSVHKIACARVQDITRKLNEASAISHSVFVVSETYYPF